MSCAICLEDLKHNLIITPCKHQFHRTCLEKWIKNSCPLCRRKIYDQLERISKKLNVNLLPIDKGIPKEIRSARTLMDENLPIAFTKHKTRAVENYEYIVGEILK